MDKFNNHKEGEDKCRYDIGWKKSCLDCLFETLCLFEKNQEGILKDSNDLENNQNSQIEIQNVE